MVIGAISLVFFKPVEGIEERVFGHEAIPGDLGDDAGCGDGATQAVAANDSQVGYGKFGQGTAIDQGGLRRAGERGKSASHGQVAGVEDIELLDLGDGGLAGRPDHGGIAGQSLIDPGSLEFREFLGIVEIRTGEGTRKDNRGGYDGAGERTSTGFINARDDAVALLRQPIFPGEIRHGRGRNGRGCGRDYSPVGAAASGEASDSSAASLPLARRVRPSSRVLIFQPPREGRTFVAARPSRSRR